MKKTLFFLLPLFSLLWASPGAAQDTPDTRKICDREIEIHFPTIDAYPLNHHVQGDKETGGQGVSVWIQAFLRKTPKKVTLGLLVKISEYPGDYTRFERWDEKVIYDMDKSPKLSFTYKYDPKLRRHCVIDRIITKSLDRTRLGHIISPHGDMLQNQIGNGRKFKRYKGSGKKGIIKNVDCRLDTKGNDYKRVGCTRLILEPIKIKLKAHNDECRDVVVSPLPQLVFPLRFAGGDDKEMGNGRHYMMVLNLNGDPHADLFATVSEKKVFLGAYLKIAEDKGSGQTAFKKKFYKTFIRRDDLPKHCLISNYRFAGDRRVAIQRRNETDQKWSWESAPSNTPIQGLNCLTDSKGTGIFDQQKDNNKLGCWIYFRPVTITTKRDPSWTPPAKRKPPRLSPDARPKPKKDVPRLPGSKPRVFKPR